jgi:hypothetical protein
MTHLWKPWNEVERCIRPGCAELRRIKPGTKTVKEYLTKAIAGGWYSGSAEPCKGGGTTNNS